MTFNKLFKAELIHFRGIRLLIPILVTLLFCYLAINEDEFALFSTGNSIKSTANGLLNFLGHGQGLLRLGLTISLMGFLYQSSGAYLLHRARIDGLNRFEWMATLNIQTILTASFYTALCILFHLVGFIWNGLNFELFFSIKTLGFMVVLFLKSFFSFYVFALLGLTLMLFLKARSLVMVFIGILVSELYLNRRIENPNNFLTYLQKYMFYNYFSYKSPEMIWPYAVSAATVFCLLQLLVFLKSAHLTRTTTL